jgi:hypothetical protein
MSPMERPHRLPILPAEWREVVLADENLCRLAHPLDIELLAHTVCVSLAKRAAPAVPDQIAVLPVARSVARSEASRYASQPTNRYIGR